MMNYFRVNAAKISVKIDEYLSAVLKGGLFKNRVFDPINIKRFNKYMMIAIAIAVSYLLLDIFISNPSKDAALAISRVLASGTSSVSSADSAMPVESKTYSHYSDKISSRNIFSAGPEAQVEPQVGAFGLEAENIGLVGIIPGDSPQAIIEDKKGQKTYYLIKGQTVNDITVTDISDGGVVLEYRGKKITLLL